MKSGSYLDPLTGKHYSEKELLRLAKKYLARNYAPPPTMFVRSEGVWLFDINGRRFLDMLSCYSALNLGHRSPTVVEAAKDQLDTMPILPRSFLEPQRILFAKELSQLCKDQMILPMNTGAEAVETAIKMARKWGYIKKGVGVNEADIITCSNNFHGRTITVISFSTEVQYRKLFGPHTQGFTTIKFGNLEELEDAITSNTVAFIVEPIQGEGGIIVPPDGYLKEARKICRKNNVLFVLDEIQTGLGRTGKIFAYEHWNAKPDVLILGKALGGGIEDISAVVASKKIMDVFEPGDHGSTFGGNPLASATGRAALQLFLTNKELLENVVENGTFFIEALKDIQQRSKYIKEVRGKGLMIGVELYDDCPFDAHEACLKLLDEGLACGGTHKYVLRISPPLIIIREEIEYALEKLEKVLTK